MNPQKILIIQTAFLGDVVLATPLIRAVKKKYPQSKITFLLIPQTEGLLQNNPDLHGIVVYAKKDKEKGIFGFLNLVKKVKASGFDLAFIPHRSLRSALLVYLARIPQRIGFNKSSGAFLFTKRVKYVHNQPEAERNLSLLEEDSLSETESAPELFPSEKDFQYVEDLFKGWGINQGDKIIGIAPARSG